MKIPVSDLYSACKMMLADQWGYIWGAAGELWTEKKQKAATREMTVKYGSRWIGHRVADCSGVMVYIWKQHGMSIFHGSNTIRKKYCGPLQNDPAPGFAAFKVKGDDFYHIGIVAEDGATVYEARGTQKGFTRSKASEWHKFAPFLDVYYGEESSMSGEPLYTATVTTKAGGLNLRTGPGTAYPRITTLERNSQVQVLEEYEQGWAYVRQGTAQGYVSTEYLTPVEGSKTPADAPDGGGVQTPTDEDPGPSFAEKTGVYTMLRHKATNVTIGLQGEWEVYAVMEDG